MDQVDPAHLSPRFEMTEELRFSGRQELLVRHTLGSLLGRPATAAKVEHWADRFTNQGETFLRRSVEGRPDRRRILPVMLPGPRTDYHPYAKGGAGRCRPFMETVERGDAGYSWPVLAVITPHAEHLHTRWLSGGIEILTAWLVSGNQEQIMAAVLMRASASFLTRGIAESGTLLGGKVWGRLFVSDGKHVLHRRHARG